MKYSWMKSLTKRSLIGITIADELWYDTLINGDNRTYWFAITSSHRKDDPDVKIYSLIIFVLVLRFGYNSTVEVAK